MFLYFLINVHAQIKKWITKSDWSHKMVAWKLAWRPYQILNVELETKKYFLCIPGCFGVFFFPVFPVYYTTDTFYFLHDTFYFIRHHCSDVDICVTYLNINSLAVTTFC